MQRRCGYQGRPDVTIALQNIRHFRHFRHALSYTLQEVWNLCYNWGAYGQGNGRTHQEEAMARLSEQELRRLIQGGETNTVELKAANSHSDQIMTGSHAIACSSASRRGRRIPCTRNSRLSFGRTTLLFVHDSPSVWSLS